MNVRQGIDEKAAAEFGGWADTSLMRRTYTHAERTTEKVHEAQLRGLREAELKPISRCLEKEENDDRRVRALYGDHAKRAVCSRYFPHRGEFAENRLP